ncbi:MAG TPA: HAMP domain-containing sensor histidine kinase [Rhodothermales bacterium]
MKAYRHSVNLKLGLVLFAVLIAVSSLLYTNRLVERLREREQFIIGLWASAQEQLVQTAQTENPFISEFRALQDLVQGRGRAGMALTEERRRAFLDALEWAQSMPRSSDVTYLTEILDQARFGIPAVVIDSSDGGHPLIWQNVGVPMPLTGLGRDDSLEAIQQLRAIASTMGRTYEPIAINVGTEDARLEQYIFYGESRIIRELRYFPYVQLLVIGLFVLIGYVGFSYVRRSEQGSLWVGMAREAAHQLGTPISSLMGWHEVLRLDDLSPARRQDALDEVGKDIDRLNRVASRFSAIGSMPRLTPTDIGGVIQRTVDYMQRRIPERGRQIRVTQDVPEDLVVPLNDDLFEWVIENLIKNALDAIESDEGEIRIVASSADSKRMHIDVSDTGKGIDRRDWKNVFRPGFSTKKRGWGLGLSLAKRIVEVYHGGRLSLLQSRPGQGTTFRIELPVN